jgi:carbon monoxide dehydrogenase subunit G
MDFTGRYVIAAPPEAVWAGLNDAVVLQSCIPGCERLTKRDDRYFDAVAALRIGPLRATFRATIEQSELDPPRRCVLKGEGRGGAAGFGRGEAEIVLEPDGDGTVLTYAARATIGGRLMQIGQRLIDGAARQIADDFFARFAAEIATGTVIAAGEAAPAMPSPVVETLEETGDTRREGLAPEIWAIGLIAVIVLLLVLFGVAL